MNRGFVYLLTSHSYLPLLRTSLHSLRRFHDEPVTVFALPELCGEVGKYADSTQEITFDLPSKKTKPAKVYHYLARTMACIRSPYDETAMIEADVLVMANLSEWFGHPLTFAQIGDRVDEHGKPLINPGIIGFGRDRTFLEMVYALARKMRNIDQRIMQRKYKPEHTRIIDDRWCLCPKRFAEVDDP